MPPPDGAVADKVIDVPGLGTVSFPGAMTDDQVSAAIYQHLNPGKTASTVEQNPGLAQMPGRSNYPVSEGMGEAGALSNIAMLGMGGESAMGAPSSTLMSTLGEGAVKALQAVGMDKAANYFVEGSNGHYSPTPRTTKIAQLHDLTGVKANDLNIPVGSLHPDSVYGTPAEGLLDAGIKPQDLQGLNAEGKIAKVQPAWQRAGQAVDDTASAATKRGVKVNVGKSVASAIDDMLDPEGTRALARTVDIFKQTVGEKANWNNVTPEDAVAFKRALWKGLPPKFRNPVYGAVTRALNDAAPEMKPANLAYNQLQTTMEGLNGMRDVELTKAGPTKFEQMIELMRNPWIRTGTAGLGGASTLAGAYSLYDMMKKR